MIRDREVTHRILKTLEANPQCDLDKLVQLCSELSWSEVFLGIDRLSRTGRVRLSRQSIGNYIISLPPSRSSRTSMGLEGLAERPDARVATRH